MDDWWKYVREDERSLFAELGIGPWRIQRDIRWKGGSLRLVMGGENRTSIDIYNGIKILFDELNDFLRHLNNKH